jgi:hypothetical protein
MKQKLLIAILAFIACLAVCPQANAQAVDGYTSIDYDDSTGLIDAYSETILDYDVACYYDAYVSLQVYNDSGALITSVSARDYDMTGFISVESFFFADAATTYTAKGTHSAYANYYDYDYFYDPDYGRYIYGYYYYDPWFFGFYEPYWIYNPWYYRFTNPYGFTQEEAAATESQNGHHSRQCLRHYAQLETTPRYGGGRSDNVEWLRFAARQIQFRVVTRGKRTVTGQSVDETFPGTTDNCNNSTVSPSGCHPTESDGTFQDASTVGCPITDSNCGFSHNDVWRWCSTAATLYRSLR